MQSYYFHIALSIASTIEIFTSFAKESNPKSLPTNAFPQLTMPQKCFGGRALLPRRLEPRWRTVQRPQNLTAGFEEGRFATKITDMKELRREKEMGRKVAERRGREGQGRKGGKKNLTLYSFVSLRAVCTRKPGWRKGKRATAVRVWRILAKKSTANQRYAISYITYRLRDIFA